MTARGTAQDSVQIIRKLLWILVESDKPSAAKQWALILKALLAVSDTSRLKNNDLTDPQPNDWSALVRLNLEDFLSAASGIPGDKFPKYLRDEREAEIRTALERGTLADQTLALWKLIGTLCFMLGNATAVRTRDERARGGPPANKKRLEHMKQEGTDFATALARLENATEAEITSKSRLTVRRAAADKIGCTYRTLDNILKRREEKSRTDALGGQDWNSR